MSKDVLLFKVIGYPLLLLFAAICLIPFLIVIGSSFTSESYIIQHGYSIWPKEWSLESYRTIFKSPMAIIRAYGVTIFVTVVGTSLSVFLNTMAGYVLQRKDFAWRNKLSFFYFFTTLFSGGLMPWYILCVRYLHLKDSIWAMILPGIVSVWNILLVKGFTASIPFEMTESAKIDGAGDFTIFCKLIWPLSKPVIATIALFTALTYWNDWYNSMLFINNSDLYSLQYQLYKLINDAKELRKIASESGMVVDTVPIESMKMALTVVVTGPIVLLYPFVQRYFVKGLTLGAVKG
ncbi:MAG: carbohydrate ABC transporter permease [Eubacteriales bacterium]|nr:carbohydrate ABC transporter permease [Eubacteriales bacterium]